VHTALPLAVSQLPCALHGSVLQSALAQSSPDQPASHVHTGVPLDESQVPFPLHVSLSQSGVHAPSPS
jgi:hypothetical protein